MMRSARIRTKAGIALLAIVAFGAVAAFDGNTDRPSNVVVASVYSGPDFSYGMQPPIGIGGAMPLHDWQGRELSSHTKEKKFVLLSFVFSRCVSSCPVSLAAGKQVLDLIAQDGSLVAVFAGLDPFNDSPEGFAKWLGQIDRRFVGLTGSIEDVETAIERYGVAVRGDPSAELLHSAVWYLLDPSGQIVRVYSLNTKPAHIASDIRRAILKMGSKRFANQS